MTMFLETIYSPGLAHLSYIVGHNGKAAVIDPRRDCEIYLEIAQRNGSAITHIFETHRNEDYAIGSVELANRCGGQIFHGPHTDFAYGHVAREGETFDIGSLQIRVLETPGHTFDSLSYVLIDASYDKETALGVFTGDALFIGDVGRTDFFPNRKEETASLLYGSVHAKLLPLGDQCILYPAHGAGSVCGSGMAPRNFSTLGYERLHNPVLQLNKEEFIQHKVAEKHPLPGYFKQMEEYNQHGNAPAIDCMARPASVDANIFAAKQADGMAVLDVRSAEAIAGAMIPGSMAMPLEVLSAYVGYFLSYGKEIGLVVETVEQSQEAVVQLQRIGYDNVTCLLHNSLTAWETSGRRYETIPAVHSDTLTQRITDNESFTLLDVRKEEEFDLARLTGAVHIFLGDLPERLHELPKDQPVTAFCGSGVRAIGAAAMLKNHGFADVEVALGSMAACMAFGCPLEE